MSSTEEQVRQIAELLMREQPDAKKIDQLHKMLFPDSSAVGANGDFKSEPKYSITAKVDTLLKSRPVDSSNLSPDEQKECSAGTDLELSELELAGNSHIKLIVNGKESPEYAFKPHWDIPENVVTELKKKRHEETAKVFKTEVSNLKLKQPDSNTCQSACIAMALGTTDIQGVRNALVSRARSRGTIAGDPAVMGWYLSRELGDRYVFDDNASMSEMREWLRDGEFLITHGWFTRVGHVIALDGIRIEPDLLAYKFDVSDPWSEFDFISWTYNQVNSIQFYDGYYSALGIYASCVAGQTLDDSRRIYTDGIYDSNRKGAWVHRIKTEKK